MDNIMTFYHSVIVNMSVLYHFSRYKMILVENRMTCLNKNSACD